MSASLALMAALAAAQPPPAAPLFAERAALLAADGRCALLAPEVREGVAAGVAQARGDLLRAGWTGRAADALAARAAAEVAARPCMDPALQDAARRAAAGYRGWARQHQAQFPGRHAGWIARRSPDPAGWVLWQDVAERPQARFGILETPSEAKLAFAAPAQQATSARLVLRDPSRSETPIDVPGRPRPMTLAEAAPSPAVAAVWHARARQARGDAVTFAFPAEALSALARLDPREAAVVELVDARGRIAGQAFIEAGDVAAALAFLKAQPN